MAFVLCSLPLPWWRSRLPRFLSTFLAFDGCRSSGVGAELTAIPGILHKHSFFKRAGPTETQGKDLSSRAGKGWRHCPTGSRGTPWACRGREEPQCLRARPQRHLLKPGLRWDCLADTLAVMGNHHSSTLTQNKRFTLLKNNNNNSPTLFFSPSFHRLSYLSSTASPLSRI